MAHDGVGDDIQAVTQGRPYVFVIRAFREKHPVYCAIRDAIEKETGLLCIDAEEVLGASNALLDRVHLLIERADLIVAEVSSTSANVFYETGYAAALGKRMILAIEQGKTMPANLRGQTYIAYTETRDGMGKFRTEMRVAARAILTMSVATLRDMLQARQPVPAYVVASPKYPGPDARIPGWVKEHRTFGDYLGIRGLLSAFGVMLGRPAGVEVVSGQYCDLEDLAGGSHSLYLVGSKRVNQLTDLMLQRLQHGRMPKWSIDEDPNDSPATGDPKMLLTRETRQGEERLEGKTQTVEWHEGSHEVYVTDYGLVLRGPHPENGERLVLVMAGAHALGTGAASIAATDPPRIREIAQGLKDQEHVDLADHRHTIWALVQGEVSEKTGYLLNPDGVTVKEVGVCR